MAESQPLRDNSITSVDYDTLRDDDDRLSVQEPLPLKSLPRTERKTTEVYKIRWYVLIVFCIAAVLQGMVLSTYGPIHQYLQLSIGWGLGHVCMLNIVMWLMLLLSTPITIWIILKNGKFHLFACIMSEAHENRLLIGF